MALRAATTAKTTSDSNKTPADVSGLAISAIDTVIAAAANAGEYIIKASYEANVREGVTTIKQSDGSYIDVETVVLTLKENGYRVSYNKKSDPGNYRLCLQVAWD